VFILSLDFLRGIAALGVAWYHFTQGSPNFGDKGLVFGSWQWGYLGYYIFFIISGFVIPWSLYIKKYTLKNYFRFIAKRIIRLEPPYLLSILLILLLNYLSSLAPIYQGPPFHIDPVNLLMHVGYLNVFSDKPWLNPVFWTLAIEFQYYLSMAIFYFLLANVRRPIRLFAYLGALALFYFFRGNGRFVFEFLPLFMLGFSTFQKKANIIGWKEYSLVSAPLIVIAARYHWAIPALCLLTVFLILGYQVKWKFGIFLGKISYSLYLLHVPIGMRVINLCGRFALLFTRKSSY
jgi:peptidoglycan/LPS O-acetylase OafA/YrhL